MAEMQAKDIAGAVEALREARERYRSAHPQYDCDIMNKAARGVGHITQDTCGKPYLPILHIAFKAQIRSAEVPRSSKESWCPSMAIRLA